MRFGGDMTDQANAEYFASRERLERDLSNRAPDPRAAAAHHAMADHYEALAKVFGADDETGSAGAS